MTPEERIEKIQNRLRVALRRIYRIAREFVDDQSTDEIEDIIAELHILKAEIKERRRE